MNVCVFCGSSPGLSPVYAEAARKVGALLAGSSHTLIYGGGHVGLMGIVADSVMANKGEVIGIIPQFLVDREVGHYDITRLEVVQSMHERKKRMADLSDAFIAFPGGMGTLEELAEILTWKQLGLINNPVIIFNLNNFFTPLLTQLDHMVQEGFLRSENVEAIRVATSPEEILSLIIPQ
jgi:uncharacterized protein (TIGR00730 family)